MTQTLTAAAETPSYLLLGVVPGAAAQPATVASAEAFNPLAGVTDLDAYKAKVERWLCQEGYTTEPRILIDRYPDTVAIGAACVGPHDCALQLIDNWESHVPAEA